MAYLQLIALVPVLWDLLERLIQSVESESLTGAEKKDLVLEALTSLLEIAGTVPGVKSKVPIDTILFLAKPIIDIVVRVFNATGVFRSAPKEV